MNAKVWLVAALLGPLSMVAWGCCCGTCGHAHAMTYKSSTSVACTAPECYAQPVDRCTNCNVVVEQPRIIVEPRVIVEQPRPVCNTCVVEKPVCQTCVVQEKPACNACVVREKPVCNPCKAEKPACNACEVKAPACTTCVVPQRPACNTCMQDRRCSTCGELNGTPRVPEEQWDRNHYYYTPGYYVPGSYYYAPGNYYLPGETFMGAETRGPGRIFYSYNSFADRIEMYNRPSGIPPSLGQSGAYSTGSYSNPWQHDTLRYGSYYAR